MWASADNLGAGQRCIARQETDGLEARLKHRVRKSR
jgi:hypothetical protein